MDNQTARIEKGCQPSIGVLLPYLFQDPAGTSKVGKSQFGLFFLAGKLQRWHKMFCASGKKSQMIECTHNMEI